jgi:hypothetical protein
MIKGKRFNGSPHPCPLLQVERGEKEGKNLTALLTLVLSCKGREEMEGKILKDPLTLTLSHKVERE